MRRLLRTPSPQGGGAERCEYDHIAAEYERNLQRLTDGKDTDC